MNLLNRKSGLTFIASKDRFRNLILF